MSSFVNNRIENASKNATKENLLKIAKGLIKKSVAIWNSEISIEVNAKVKEEKQKELKKSLKELQL
jgi:hypothetical protein